MPSSIRAKSYLAFDLGAESGRAVLAHLQSGILTTEETHRFANEPIERGGSLYWDTDKLWCEVRKALVRQEDSALESIGVDAWGVDYALLGERGELLHNPYHYRDPRTNGVMKEVFERVTREEIYRTTGIQFMPINTLYQLFSERQKSPNVVSEAKRLVMIPDLFNYWLTGKAVCEFTNATTTQMVDPVERTWATELMGRLDLPVLLPAPIVEPGSIIATLLSDLVGQSTLAGTSVVAPACHDTGSAVAAISARDGTAFLSSGTWSLVGCELDAPIITSEALRLNFTNEGGIRGTTRLLKNVMGLWIVQCCRKSWAKHRASYNYAELMELASREISFRYLIDPDNATFLSPPDMVDAIDAFCSVTGQASPQTPGAYVRAILESLAFKYRIVLRNLEQVIGRPISQIRIIGGGSRNRLLNQLTADATGRRVLAGPAEATAIGNVAVQILATGGASSLQEVRDIVDRSFPTEVFEPLEPGEWDRHAQRFEQYCEGTYA